MSDEELLAAYYGCDSNALASLWYGQKQPKRIGYFFRLNGYLKRQFPAIREEDRHNLVAEIGLQLAQSKHGKQFDTSRRFQPWLFQIAKNKVLDFLKAKGNQVLTGQETAEGGHFDASSHRTPEAYGFEDHDVDRAYVAIDQVPEAERDVLLLRLNGLTNQDVASVLGIAEGTASNRLNKALQLMGNTMTSSIRDDHDSLDPTANRFFRQLQERHEHELTLALERMKRHNFEFDKQGRIVGGTNALQRGDYEYLLDHLRGILPVYLLRHGIDTQHANRFYDFVQQQLPLLKDSKNQRFRLVFAGLLTAYCQEQKLTANPAQDDAEFLNRLLMKEADGAAWVREMKEWLPQGTIRSIDDLVNPLQWPTTLWKQKFFMNRMRQLHGALTAVLKTEHDLLDGENQ